MIRPCSKCGMETIFPDDQPSRKGFWCNPCRSKASVESARKHRDRKRRNNNAYHARNSANRKHRTAKWRFDHPEKRLAHQAVQSALRNGSLKKSPCQVCGSTTRIHGHHDDYSQPLVVAWLCHQHHMERHAMLKAREVE